MDKNKIYRVHKSCVDFLLQGDAHIAVLLIHGFHGSNTEIRPLAEYLFRNLGYTVRGVRLPGHGTSVVEMATIKNGDYLNYIFEEYQHLRDHYKYVVVIGFSMGALLATHLAAKRDVDLLVLMGMPIWILKKTYSQKLLKLLAWVLSFIWPFIYKFETNNFYDKKAARKRFAYAYIPMVSFIELFGLIEKTMPLFKKITCPTLVIHSRQDTVCAPESSEEVIRRLGTTDKEMIWVEESSHILCLDQKKDEVLNAVGEFTKNHIMNKRW